MIRTSVAISILSAQLVCASVYGQEAGKPSRRVVFNEDGQILVETPKEGAIESVKAWLDRTIEAVPFTTFVMQAAVPDICLYETKVGEVYGDRFPDDFSQGPSPGIRALRAAGTDSLRVVTEHMHSRGKEVLAAVRMSDTHHRTIDINEALCPMFTIEHPEYVIKQPDGRTNETALDYSYPEVRAHRLAIMKEIVEEYDVDGLELNFVRWAKHFPLDKGYENSPVMTVFMGEVDKMMKSAARKRDRKRLTLGVRVPESINACWLAGVDIETWVKNGWIDYVVVCTYNNSDPRVPVEQFARFTRSAGIDTLVVMGSLMGGNAHRGPPTILDRGIGMLPQRTPNYNGVVLLEAEARGMAANYFAWGATGVSFWNLGTWFGRRELDPLQMERTRRWTRAVQSPRGAWAGPREYHFIPMGKGISNYAPPRRNYPWAVENHNIIGEPKGPVILFTNSSRHVFPFRMADGRYGEKLTGTLRFWVYHLDEGDRLDIDINGKLIESAAVGRVKSGERRGGLPGMRFEVSLSDCPSLKGDNDLGLTLQTPGSQRPAPLMEELVLIVQKNSLPYEERQTEWSATQTKKPIRIYIAVDSEGPTGVDEYWSRNGKPDTPAFRRYQDLVVGDIDAAIQGCFSGGADEVYVRYDGFGDKTFVRNRLDRRATLLPNGGPILNGLDHSFAGVMLVGFHAMEGAKDGVLAHTWSSARRRRYTYNGREGGEVFVYATVAGHDHNIPVIMATGCAGLCREVHELLGEDVVTAAVKSVCDDGSVELLSPDVTRRTITTAATKAVNQIHRCRPYKPAFPIRVVLQLSDGRTTDGYILWRHDNKSDWPGKKVDDRTVETMVTSTRHLAL